MTKLLPLLLACLLAPACASTSTSAPKRTPSSTSEHPTANCDEQQKQSELRLQGLQRVFEAYKQLSLDLAVKFVPGLRAEVRDLQERLDLQRRLCWASERRQVEIEINQLRSELDRLFIQNSFQELRSTMEKDR